MKVFAYWEALQSNGYYPTKVGEIFVFLSRSDEREAVLTTYDRGYHNHWGFTVALSFLHPVVRDNLPPFRNFDGTIVEG